ncbi:MAG: alpha/beta fold hydrolase [Candidatus Rokubacteria bacterium]|nr:alpha/beta fold hydrolase [Candidatus Rokubacteria bacterium]
MREHINGTVLAWDESGAGEPALLVHGIGETRSAWRHQLEDFGARFRVIACDVRGFGESETGDGAGSVEQLAADLRALLDRLGAGPARVIGFSMGGVIAQRFALDHPDMTRAVVIAASSSVVNRRAADYYLERAALAERDGVAALRAAAMGDAAVCFTVSGADIIEAYREVRRNGVRDAAGFANAARAMASLLEAPLTEALAGLRAPALVITGERDIFCPPKASEIIHARIRGSLLRIVPAVGHCLHWEDPATFNRTVLDFLASA